MKGSKKLVVGVVGVGVLAAVVAWGLGLAIAADSDGDGRDQTAVWVTDATGGYLLATATTTSSTDWAIELEVKDSTNKVIGSIFSNSADGMAGGGSVNMKDDLPGYASGASFTIVAKYYDRRRSLLDTESVPFTKP